MISKKIKLIKFLLKTSGILYLSAFIVSCAGTSETPKINGISLVASRDSLTSKQLTRIIEVNANAVAVMPYAFLNENDAKPELHFNSTRQWYGERVQGIEQAISQLKSEKFQVMLKPHIWRRNGEFTGDLDLKTDAKWTIFESSYRDDILLYAEIAEKHEIELFCIGTELFTFTQKRPEFWKQLIIDLREVYSGKLVYAENWDKASQTDIWRDLDYIGVDAYFPLSDEVAPQIETIRKGWKKHKNMLEALSEEYSKPILFTEYGYRSMDFALKEPWQSDRKNKGTNHGLQSRALEATFLEFWDENWFAGGFLWKWHQHESSGGLENDRFTPQNKPAERTVREYYGKFRN